MAACSSAERSASAAGVVERRWFTVGSTVAGVQQRSAVGVVSWSTVLGDVRGSVAVTVPRGSSVVTSNWWAPFGARRGVRVDTVGSRGYLGQAEDVGSGLTYLNHRFYDSSVGVFLSVDPLVAVTGDPYLYAAGNPTTLADPTGLTPCRPSEEFGCGPIMDKPDRICAVAPNWPGCAQKPPPAKEVQKWVDTCQGGWTYCNQLVTDGGIYDNPAAWQAFSALTILLGLGYLEVQGADSYQAYLFANSEMLPKGFDNFHVQVQSGSAGALMFGVVPVTFKGPFDGCGWQCAIATITTGVVSFGTAGAFCAGATVVTLGAAAPGACTAGWFAATGVTSVVYEATSRKGESVGDLACAFLFGPTNQVANIAITSAGGRSVPGAAKAVTQSFVVDQALQSVGIC